MSTVTLQQPYTGVSSESPTIDIVLLQSYAGSGHDAGSGWPAYTVASVARRVEDDVERVEHGLLLARAAMKTEDNRGEVLGSRWD